MNNGNSFNWNQQIFPKILRKNGYQTAIYGKSHLKGRPQGFDDWAVLPGQGLYYNPDMIFADGRRRINGYCTDVVTDLAVNWLKNKRNKNKPFMMMVQHKAPHRNWMPALRHLTLYDDITIPEPPTLFDKWEDNAPPARHQELEIDRHMDLNYDLFVDLTPDFEQPPSQKRQDRSAWFNMKRMSNEQLTKWREAYAPKDEAFHKANLKDKELLKVFTPKHTRSFCYIEDFINGLFLLIKKPSKNFEIFNIGNNEEIKIISLAKKINTKLGKNLIIKKKNIKKGGTTKRVPNINKLKKIGYKIKFNLNKGLDEFLRKDVGINEM